MDKIKQRLAEPSTYAGVAGILIGLDQIFNLHGVPEAAQAVAQAGAVAGQGGSIFMTLGTLATALLAVFLPEKKK